MQCNNDNVSEAGPDSGSDFDAANNIPFLNDSSELDYISKIGGTGLVAENLRKQSLYVKFDPLVADEGNNTTQNGDLTLHFDQSLNIRNSGGGGGGGGGDNDNGNGNGNGNGGSNTCISNYEQERSFDIANNTIDFSNDDADKSNAPRHEVTESNDTFENVGKLISVTPSKSPKKVTPKSSPRYAEMDLDDAIELKSLLFKQMKKEKTYRAENEALKCENERLLQKLHDTEKEMNLLRTVLETTQDNEKKLKNELIERTKNTQQLSAVMGEYEKTISQMLTKRDEEKNEFETTVRKIETERDSTVQHLNNLENAFNDIHQKYERGKAVNEALKKNEDLLKKSLCDYEQTVKTVENKYELLKSHATSQLDKANQELELITQSYEKEQAKLQAMLRKSEIQISSLQNALERKTSENQELTAICDELIVKLSTHSAS